MNARHLLTAILWGLGLVGALMLTSEPQLDRAKQFERVTAEMREVQFEEVRLDGELMRVLGAATPGYDTLKSQIEEVRRAAQRVGRSVDRLELEPALYDEIVRTIDTKLARADAFSGDHTATREATAAVAATITETLPLLAAVPADVVARVGPGLGTLWQDVQQFAQQGGAEAADSIRGRLDQLEQAPVPAGPLPERMKRIATQVREVLTARTTLDDHLGAYFALQTAPSFDALAGVMATEREKALTNASARRNLRLVLVGLLVLLAVQGLWGLRRRTLSLEEGLEARTLALEAANAELEAEVEARRRTENELAEALKKSRAATQAKADFLANMSHEIRTPMNGVVGMTTLLLDTRMDDEQLGYVTSIERSGTALLTVINDILDFSKIEAGRMDIEATPFDVHQVVRDVTEVLGPAAHGKDIRIEFRVEKDVPQWVVGDAVRLRQILLNLAGNAVKFTRQGKVSVEIAQRGPDMLEFSVADTGIGIPAEKLRYIFDAFSQADSSTTRKFGGTGLGLAICRRLAELMRGEIRVESQVGRGSRFRVSLPMSATAEPIVQGQGGNRATDRILKPVTDQIRVLLAEDNVINQRVATRLLEKLGCEVASVDDGSGAVEQALAQEYDVIFMDCQMPRMDGYAATRTLRSQGYERPIVAMTANAMPGDRERCLESGMDDYIPKPIARGELERVLRTWAPSTNDDDSPSASLAG